MVRSLSAETPREAADLASLFRESEGNSAQPQPYQLVFEPVGFTAEDLDQTAYHWLLEDGISRAGVSTVRHYFVAEDGEEVPLRIWTPTRRPRAFAALLHGACDYSRGCEELGASLAASGIAAFAYDQRGFGSRLSRGRSLDPKLQISDLKRASAAFKEKIFGFFGPRLSGTPFFTVGESMGGAFALRAAAEGFDTDGLVLVAPATLACPVRRFGFRFSARILWFLAPWSRWRIERQTETDLSDVAAIRFLGDPLVLRRVPSRMMAELIDLAIKTPGLASRVRVPVLTLFGSRENVLRRECIEDLVGRFQGPAKLEVVEDGDHFLLHSNANQRVFRLLTRWMLSECSKRGR